MEQALQAECSQTVTNKRIKKTMVSPCDRCEEMFPAFQHEVCNHRICGECIPSLLCRAMIKSIPCPPCFEKNMETLIPVSLLGAFLDEQISS
jgi:hypothetical protein